MRLLQLILFLLWCIACGSNAPEPVEPPSPTLQGYHITKPDSRFVLPDILKEVSGLTILDNSTVVCIQDEQGVLFIYDVLRNQMKEQRTFYFNGDYEGIAKVSDSIYILRSDGTLFEIPDYNAKEFKVNSYATGIPASNNEGLCYDKKNNRLLIACKGRLDKDPSNKEKRAIYGFDLKNKVLDGQPAYSYDLGDVRTFAEEKGIKLPVKYSKSGKVTENHIKVRTSAIAFHPITNKLFMLSDSDHLLIVFNEEKKIDHVEVLDAELFNKAEGITFFDNGDMLITNEAQDKKPTLLRFNYNSK